MLESGQRAAAPKEKTSAVCRKEKLRERFRVYNNLKAKKLVLGCKAELYLTPFHHINLLFRELNVSLMSIDEARETVRLISDRYTEKRHSQKKDKSPRQKKQTAESILSASQVSMSQYEERERTSRRSALLLDALESLCATRELELERHTGKSLQFSRADLRARKVVLIYVDKCDPYFVSVAAVPSTKIWRKKSLLHFKTDKKSSSLIQVTCCSPYPTQWRFLTSKSVPKLRYVHCVAATISVKKDAEKEGPGSDTCSPEKTPAAGSKRQRGGDLAEGDEASELLEPSPVSSCSSRSTEPSSDEDGESTRDGVRYPKTPYQEEAIFHREDVVEDPFLRLPRGYTVRKPSTKWYSLVLSDCSGSVAKNIKRTILEESQKLMATEGSRYGDNEEDFNDFL